jgi:hypothetical protein
MTTGFLARQDCDGQECPSYFLLRPKAAPGNFESKKGARPCLDP